MWRYIIFFLFISCGQFSFLGKRNPFNIELDLYKPYAPKDYLDSLSTLSRSLRKNQNVTILKLPKRYRNYLEGLFSKIISNNEQIFKNPVIPEFIILKDPRPMYFSLPYGKLFFSTGLFKKYRSIIENNLYYCESVITLTKGKSFPKAYP